MTGVFDSYEQQFSTITADITARIGEIPNLTGSKSRVPALQVVRLVYTCIFPVAEKKTAIGVVQGNLDEAGELVSS